MRTAEDNAREFGQLTTQGYGVRLAVLAACTVQTPGKGTRKSGSRHSSKMVISEFVDLARKVRGSTVSDRTVRRYLRKWDTLVGTDWPGMDRANLTPDDVDTLDLSDGFIEAFNHLATLSDDPESDLDGKAADIAQNTKAMARAIKADPKAAKAAAAALADGGASHLTMAEVSDLVTAGSDQVVSMVGGNPNATPISGMPKWRKALSSVSDGASEFRAELATMSPEVREKALERASEVIDHVISCLTVIEEVA